MSRQTRKRKPVQPSNVWVCQCNSDQVMTADEFRQHLVDAHGIPPQDQQGKRTFKFHIDADDFYQSGYAWTIQGVQATQIVTRPRQEGWPG